MWLITTKSHIKSPSIHPCAVTTSIKAWIG